MSLVNIEELRQAFIERRQRYHLSLDDVADVSGVHKSTLSRFERGGGNCDTDTMVRIIQWVHHDNNVSGGAVSSLSPIDAVKKFTNEDPSLTPEAAVALQEMFTVAYRHLVEDRRAA